MVGKRGQHNSKKEESICECGILVKGISAIHLKANIILHKKSKLHKQLIKNKEKQDSEINLESVNTTSPKG